MFAERLSTIAAVLKNPVCPVTDNTLINVNMLDAAYSVGIEKHL